MATKDVSDPNKKISVTQPGTRLGKDFHATRANLPPSKYNSRYQSRSFAESLGDSGGFSTIDHKRYQVILSPEDKGTRHGFDAVLRERATGKIIVVEHKGQNATESTAQRQPDKWIQKVNAKTINRQGNYAKSTRQEVAASHAVDRAMRDGNLEYQLHRTHIDANGRMHTDVEKQVRISEKGQPAQGGPVRTSVIAPGPAPTSTPETHGRSAETAPMSDQKKPVPKPGSGASFKNFNLKPQSVTPAGHEIKTRGDTTKPQTVTVPEHPAATFRGFGAGKSQPGHDQPAQAGPPSKPQAAADKTTPARPAEQSHATHPAVESPAPKPAPTVPPPKKPMVSDKSAADKTVKTSPSEPKSAAPRPADRNLPPGPPAKQSRQGTNPAPARAQRPGDLKRVQANIQKISAAGKQNQAPVRDRGPASPRTPSTGQSHSAGRSSGKGGSSAGKGIGGRSAGGSAPSRGGGGGGRGR